MREGKVFYSLFLFGKRRNCIDLIFRVCVCKALKFGKRASILIARFLSDLFCVKANLEVGGCGVALELFDVCSLA